MLDNALELLYYHLTHDVYHAHRRDRGPEMQRPLIIQGGTPLRGELRVNPAKNAALPILVGSLLTREPITLTEVPRLRDIEVLLELLAHLGTRYAWEGRTLHLHTPEIQSTRAPYELVSKMRASFIVLGALLAREGEGEVSMPGGCAFGPRPVDLHIKALRDLGIEIQEENGTFTARRNGWPEGEVVFDRPTVGGTEQVMLAAALGPTEVTIVNAALEPEIVDFAGFLQMLGVQIEGAGTAKMTIRGAEALGGGSYKIIPDRIEAGTYLLAAAATRGEVLLEGANPEHMDALLSKLKNAGHTVLTGTDWVRLKSAREPEPFDVDAREYPGFPTDLQPPVTAYLATVPGVSLVRDLVYPDRFTHVGELARLGAELHLKERVLAIHGRNLTGARIKAFDIRGGGAMVIAALAAEGETVLEGMQHIRRGYEDLEDRLRQLGAVVYDAPVTLEQAAD